MLTILKGLEYAEKHPDKARTTFRYGLGVLAPVLAWPTMIMPVQYALTAQFGAFVFMYFADARATTRGWAPTWYGTYRFVLTAIVGLSLFISLVGREKVGAEAPRLTGLREKFHKEQPNAVDMKKYEEMEAVELEKNRKKKAAEDRKKAAEEEIQKLEEEKTNAESDKKKVDEEKPKKGKAQGKEKSEGKEKSDDKEKSEGKKSEGEEKPESKDKESKDQGESKDEKSQEGGKDEGEKDKGGDDAKEGGKEEGSEDKKDDKSE